MAQQPEAKLSSLILKEWKKRGVWCYKVHGGPMQMAGVPDICGVYDGLSVWCETKVGKNKTSKIQDQKIKEIRAAGGAVVVAYSLEEAIALIDHLDAHHFYPNDEVHWDCPYFPKEEA